MKRNTRELNKLERYLRENGFEYVRVDEDNTYPADVWQLIKDRLGDDAHEMDRHQIIVFEKDGNGVVSWDVICHYGSYGCNEGLLEGSGVIFRADVEGWLTAADVIKRIEEGKQ